jgi:hypothetical protein
MTTPVYGVDECFFSRLETVFDEITNAIASAFFDGDDAIGLMSLDIVPTLLFIESEEKTSDPDLVTEIEDKQGGTYTAVAYYKPNPSLGTEPDLDSMLIAGIGQKTIDPGVSVLYGLNQLQPSSLIMGKRSLDGKQELISGVWIENIVFGVTSGGIPTMTFTGGFASYGFHYGVPQTDNTGYAGGLGTVGLEALDAKKLRRGALVAFGVEDNGGAGYIITARDIGANTIDFLPVLANPIPASITTIVPVSPAIPVLAGNILGAINNNLLVDAVSLGNIAYTGTLATGIHALDREHTTDRVNRIGRGKRSYTADLEFYFLDENVEYLGGNWDGEVVPINCRIGPDTAGQRMTIRTPASRTNVAQVVTPPDVENTWVGSSKARTAVAPNDMFNLFVD